MMPHAELVTDATLDEPGLFHQHQRFGVGPLRPAPGVNRGSRRDRQCSTAYASFLFHCYSRADCASPLRTTQGRRLCQVKVVKIIDWPPITIIDGNRVIGWMR